MADCNKKDMCPFGDVTGMQLGEYIQMVKDTREDVSEILKHARATNGRVGSLEVKMETKVDNKDLDKVKNILYKIVGIGLCLQIIMVPIMILIVKHFMES